MAREQEIGSVYLCETGIFCSGSTIKVDEDNELTVFVAFTGGPLGQGGTLTQIWQAGILSIFSYKGDADLEAKLDQ